MKRKREGGPVVATTDTPIATSQVASQKPHFTVTTWATYCQTVERYGSDSSETAAAYVSLTPDHRVLADAMRRTDQASATADPPTTRRPRPRLKEVYAPMPTSLCRVTPFFPLNRNQLNCNTLVKGMVLVKNSWGELRYTGPVLSTYDEDVLLAILALLDDPENRHLTHVGDAETYAYTGPLLPILRLLGYATPGADHYQRVIDSLRLMSATAIELRVYGRNSRNKRTIRQIEISNMVSYTKLDTTKHLLSVVINPYFYEMYIAQNRTLLHMIERATLKSPVAKAILRFIESHKDSTWRGHILTVAAAINLAPEQALRSNRRLIRRSLDQLKHVSCIEDWSINADNILTIQRRPRLKRRTKAH